MTFLFHQKSKINNHHSSIFLNGGGGLIAGC